MVPPEPPEAANLRAVAAFPDASALCERCGYPLRDLPDDGDCPECGLPVAASDPVHRVGPAWQHRRSLANWGRAALGPYRHPHGAFRRMTLAGSNSPPRGFALSIAFLVGLGWLGLDLVGTRVPPLAAAAEAAGAMGLCLALTYLEAGGVWFFSRRRGWRVPLWLAERLACYATPGWLATLPLAWGLRAVAGWTLHTGAWLTLTNPLAGWSLFLAWAVAFAAVILPFELLVYFGVRQVRYANSPPAPAPAPGGAPHGGDEERSEKGDERGDATPPLRSSPLPLRSSVSPP